MAQMKENGAFVVRNKGKTANFAMCYRKILLY